MKRSDILDKAKECVCGQRETDYGSPEDNFNTIAKFWSAYKEVKFSADDVAIMMALLKIARLKSGNATLDSFVDLAGYAACGGEIAMKKKEEKKNTETKKEVVATDPKYNVEDYDVAISIGMDTDAMSYQTILVKSMEEHGVRMVTVKDLGNFVDDIIYIHPSKAPEITNHPDSYGWLLDDLKIRPWRYFMYDIDRPLLGLPPVEKFVK